MLPRIYIFLILSLSFCLTASGQTVMPAPTPLIQPAVRSADPLQNISNDTDNISRALNTLNNNWRAFFDSFTSNQGLKMSDKQQKILFAFEILNRSEQSVAGLQRSKLDYVERQSRLRLQLASVTDDLLPQSLDRYVALRGTTDAEGLRDIRRQALQKERNDLTDVLGRIQTDLANMDSDIRRIDQFVKNLRQQLFPKVENELSNL